MQQPETQKISTDVWDPKLVVVAGAKGVGKTSVIGNWVRARGTKATLVDGDLNKKVVKDVWPGVAKNKALTFAEWHTLAALDDEEIISYLKFVETADVSQAALKYKDIDAVVLVFSFDSWPSFEFAQSQLSNIMTAGTRPKTIAVLGNKSDIPRSAREVMKSHIDDLRRKASFTYFEGTAVQASPGADTSLYLIDYVVRSAWNSIQQATDLESSVDTPFLPALCGGPTTVLKRVVEALTSYTAFFTRR